MYPMAPESVDFMNVKNVETAFYPYKLCKKFPARIVKQRLTMKSARMSLWRMFLIPQNSLKKLKA